jgi:hypothetical protein
MLPAFCLGNILNYYILSKLSFFATLLCLTDTLFLLAYVREEMILFTLKESLLEPSLPTSLPFTFFCPTNSYFFPSGRKIKGLSSLDSPDYIPSSLPFCN